MGKKLVLTGTTLTDLTAPKLAVVDPIESAGSLLLLDPMHPTQQWAAGVPVNSSTVPNLLSTALGTATVATVLVGGAINDGTKGKVERSGKGGLHVIVSQANALASGDGLRLKLSSTLTSYIKTNTSHSYYLSVWDRLTRTVTGGTYISDYPTSGLETSGIAHGVTGGAWKMPSGSAPNTRRDLAAATGLRFGNIAVSASVSSGFVDEASLPEWGAAASSMGANRLAVCNTHWTSFVFYRVYLEDLTVSGRTYAQVDAIDYALYQNEVLTSGGRYYGDTFTDPATVP